MRKYILLGFLFFFVNAYSQPIDESILHTPPGIFTLTTSVITQNQQNFLHLNWVIKPGNFLYQRFITVRSKDCLVGKILFPKGDVKHSEVWGELVIYPQDLSLDVPLENPAHHKKATFIITYQGCSEDGQCYPPEEAKVTQELP